MKRINDSDAYFADDRSTKGAGGGEKNDLRRRRRNDQSKPGLPGQRANLYRSVRVSKIVDPEPNRELDDDLVHDLAESVQTVGVIHPIVVRTVKVEGESRVRTVLVAGAYRLKAARTLGLERIECKYVENNSEAFLRQVQIAEDLFRKRIPALRRAELVLEWCELQSKGRVSGQDDQKKRRGRPRGGDSELARKLPIGGSVEARRQLIKRSKKIARITPEGKQAAIDAGFIDNEKALLAIGRASGVFAQINKAQALAQVALEFATEAVSENIVVDGDAETTPKSKEPGNEHPHDGGSDPLEVTYADMLSLWNPDGHRCWTYLPLAERERFITMLRHSRCKAHKEYAGLVADVFIGRGRVYADDLDALAAKRGLSRTAVRAVVKARGHRKKRDRKRVYYRNRNKNWKNELPKISNSELAGQSVEQGNEDGDDG